MRKELIITKEYIQIKYSSSVYTLHSNRNASWIYDLSTYVSYLEKYKMFFNSGFVQNTSRIIIICKNMK